jgi:hypothetical protein
MNLSTSRLRFVGLVIPLALAALVSAAPALAQYYPPGPGPYYPRPDYALVPPHEAVAIARSRGFAPFAAPRLRGRFWVVPVVDQYGERVRVIVDATSGRLIDTIAIGPRPPRGVPYGAMNPDEPDELSPRVTSREPLYPDEPPPSPPTLIPRPGAPMVPPHSSVPGPQLPPQTSTPQSTDPLLGVPPEFRRGTAARDQQKDKKPAVAARTPGDLQRSVPLPKPRPNDLPAIATSPSDPVTTGSVPAQAPKPSDPSPPVQPLE